MPSYTVTAPAGRLNASHKADIAAAITRVHNSVTGAPTYFAQVIFVDVQPGNYFIGGVPLAADQVFVHGQIRAGRSAADKDKLIAGLLKEVAQAADAPHHAVWVYILDLVPRQMAEFGHVLPEPGGEAAWTAGLPKEDRERMEKIGR
jgi:phenylpyruvate tautomerase PptA (4-oxalocrotonate tautomerase family)